MARGVSRPDQQLSLSKNDEAQNPESTFPHVASSGKEHAWVWALISGADSIRIFHPIDNLQLQRWARYFPVPLGRDYQILRKA
jgi:hypothetical protein